MSFFKTWKISKIFLAFTDYNTLTFTLHTAYYKSGGRSKNWKSEKGEAISNAGMTGSGSEGASEPVSTLCPALKYKPKIHILRLFLYYKKNLEYIKMNVYLKNMRINS